MASANRSPSTPTATRKRAAPKRSTRRSNGTRSGRSASRSTTVGELERIIRGLEAQIAHLTNGREIRSTVSGAADQVSRSVSSASHQMGDLVADTLTEVADRFRSGATSVTGAARIGTGAVQKIGAEIERRPLMTVAIALGIGFLAGLAGRRDQA